MSQMDKFQYDDLPSDQAVIRYLILEPGQGDDPIICNIRTSPLASIPYFEAISYVWGNPELIFPITVSGKELLITRNLREALLQLRLPTNRRALWADGICINQSDNDEKAHQVALMGQLYTKANRTLICLGRDRDYTEEAEQVASLVTEVSDMVLKTLKSIKLDLNAFPFPDRDDPLLADERWGSLRMLFEQPWWDRGWVIQEAWLGRDVKMLWVDSEFEWLAVVRALSWINTRATEIYTRHAITMLAVHETQYGLRYPQEAMPLRVQKPSEYFPDVMDWTRSLQLTDQRDRIYAFMSLAKPGEIAAIVPDYKKPYLEVYRDFARKYINGSSDLKFLLLIDHNQESFDADYPSWVPRWDLRVVLENTPHMANFLPGTFFADAGVRTLTVRGRIIASVEFVSADVHWVMTGLSDIIKILRELMGTGISHPYTKFPAVLAFADAIVAGVHHAGRPTYRADRAAYINRLLEAGIPGTEVGDDNRFQKQAEGGDVGVFHSWVRAWGHTRRVIQTDRGHYGLAPGIASKGDVVCALAGASTLLTLRRVKNGEYKIVGPTYVVSAEATVSGDPLQLGSERDRYWQGWGVEEDIIIC
ncbi:hypothetical protein jhhlp_004907 [Lomentospora prolificans]|uniref:Heterokaryon incompatibility domain-containing protein n=1 Tax=Lomentospora prolificans TaxID=41688 RepID=A0A2N3N834_9PEZI|nr:hypothetical protein jhhlp_004907 [Lomentospora prolificans]